MIAAGWLYETTYLLLFALACCVLLASRGDLGEQFDFEAFGGGGRR